MQLKFKDLTADDIECRVNTVSDKGCSLLLYKDARCDMRILDEAVGPMNWKRSHELINGNLFCNVSIFDSEKKENTEKKENSEKKENTDKKENILNDEIIGPGNNFRYLS